MATSRSTPSGWLQAGTGVARQTPHGWVDQTAVGPAHMALETGLDARVVSLLVVAASFDVYVYEENPARTKTRGLPSGTWLTELPNTFSRATLHGSWLSTPLPPGAPSAKIVDASLDCLVLAVNSVTGTFSAFIDLGINTAAASFDAVVFVSSTATASFDASVVAAGASLGRLRTGLSGYVQSDEVMEGMSEALREAYASAPVDEVVYHTLEIYHPAFTVPIRVVRDTVEFTAYLELDAPRDPGLQVTFVPYAFNVVPPDVQSTGMPQCLIEIDNVAREILAQVQMALHSMEKVTIIYRQYLESDHVLPQNNPPLELTVYDIKANLFRITAVCGFVDLVNWKYPREEFTTDRFPGLIAS